VSGNMRRATEKTGKTHAEVGLALQNSLAPPVVERIIQQALDSRVNETKWRKSAERANALMKQKGWWNQPKYAEAVRRIQLMLDHFSQPNIQKKVRAKTSDAEQITKGLQKYGHLIADWPQVLQGIQRLKAAAPLPAAA